MNPSAERTLQYEAVELAEAWQNRAEALFKDEEKQYQKQIKHLLTHPEDKITLTTLIDQSFRSENYRRVADQVTSLLKQRGIPGFFSPTEKILMHLFLSIGRLIPRISVPKMIEKMRADSNRAIVPGEPDVLMAHLQKRKSQGIRMNINHLGEAVLVEE